MSAPGWNALLDGAPWFTGQDAYPITAYSEFMPPPLLGVKPYRHARREPSPFADDDPHGWQVTEYEEALELRPGLEQIGRQLVEALVRLAHGRPGHGIAPKKLIDNPYWPLRLAENAGAVPHERFVFLGPLALSRTQDDKGRVRWTLFGASEQGPERAFWKSFQSAPGKELPETAGVDFVRRLLGAVYGVEAGDADNLHALGFRVLPTDGRGGATPPLRAWPAEDDLPAWTLRYRCNQRRPAQGVKYLLTFRPFGRLPEAIQTAYLEGRLHLIPYPGSLIFWGAPGPLKMRDEAPLAVQTPLLTVVSRHEAPQGLRVPQAGWMHEPKPGKAEPDHQYGPLRNTFRRTHRWAKVLRDQDELALMGREDKLLHVLFSTIPDDLGLYDKPMARNVQMWTHDFRFLLNGPRASGVDMMATLRTVEEGGVFGYRFVYPAMRVGRHEVYWHRPLVAWMDESGRPAVLPDAPLGYLTAYRRRRAAGRSRGAVAAPAAARPAVRRGRNAAIRPRAVGRPQRPQAVRRLGSGRREGAVVVVRPVAARGAQAPDASSVAGRAARGDRRRRGRRTAGRGREGASRTGRDGHSGRSRRERRRLAERVAHRIR